MSAELCARCGHALTPHIEAKSFPFRCRRDAGKPRPCRCPGYLTTVQFQALESLRSAEDRIGRSGYQEEELEDAAREVLKAFS